ncbi:MAG: 4-hydroxy-tetrahydrodipicolinate synthase [Candidatus Babeliaceae bacterium]|nr:4-hydroxy-tetrahydrodipicolinate synthase [Candidatus Babeliaceae bacterium]
MTTLFQGSGVAIVTPFHADGSVNFKKLEELIDWQIRSKTDAIIICGTTGEASTLDDEEHLACIRSAVEVTNKRVPVIAGTGSNDTKHGIHLSKEAQRLGADGLLQVTPYYNKCTQNGLIQHFSAIAATVDLPIMLYNVPSRTGMNITPKTIASLSQIDNIVALKEASGNISQVAEIAQLTQGKIDLYSGNDDQIVPILSLGGKGVVSVVANILPTQTHDLVMHYLEGRCKESLDLQLRMLNVINNLFTETNPIPVKAAMNLMGLDVGSLRLPLTDMESDTLARLRQAMTDYGIEVTL